MESPSSPPSGSGVSRWAMTSRALWGGVVAFVVAAVILGGVWAGSVIADRRSARAEAAAVATREAVPAKPVRPVAPGPTPDLVQVPGQVVPKPGIAGVVLDVTGSEITVKSRQGPTGRIIVGPNTILRRRGQQIALSDLKPRDRVIAVGKPNPRQRTLQASLVVVDPPGGAARPRGDGRIAPPGGVNYLRSGRGAKLPPSTALELVPSQPSRTVA